MFAVPCRVEKCRAVFAVPFSSLMPCRAARAMTKNACRAVLHTFLKPRQIIGAGLLVHGAFVVKLLNHYFGKPHLAFRDNCQGHTLLSYCCSYHVCTHNEALLLSSQDAFVRGCNGQRHGAWGSGRWAATRLDQWAVVHVEQWAVASLSGRGVSSGRHVVTLEQS